MPNIRVSDETLKKMYQLKAWFELSKGEKYTVDKTLNEIITGFLDAVTIPIPIEEKIKRTKDDE